MFECTMLPESDCIINVRTSLGRDSGKMLTCVSLEMSGVCKAKHKKERCVSTILWSIKFFSTVMYVNNSEKIYMYTGMEQLPKWVVDGGDQVSQCWGGKQARGGG